MDNSLIIIGDPRWRWNADVLGVWAFLCPSFIFSLSGHEQAFALS
jgi:hypothetical protein